MSARYGKRQGPLTVELNRDRRALILNLYFLQIAVFFDSWLWSPRLQGWGIDNMQRIGVIWWLGIRFAYGREHEHWK